jgi:predicted DNA-binding transcriptional regulator AlpA
MDNELRNLIDGNSKTKSRLIELREKIEDMTHEANCIDRLMREKVDDYILVDEVPMPIQIGSKTIWIGSFTIDNQYTFFNDYPKILASIGADIVNFEMLCDGGELYKYLTMHKKLYKKMIKLIGKTILKQQDYWQNARKDDKKYKLTKCSTRYFRKHVTIEKLIQICYLIYLYNFDSEKKNLQIILGRMDKTHLTEMYMYGWLKNLAGLTGKFQRSQLINVDYWDNEEIAEKINLRAKKKDMN